MEKLLSKIHKLQDAPRVEQAGLICFYIALVAEALLVVVDKSAFINPFEGRIFQVTFALCVVKVLFTKYEWREYLAIFLCCGVGLIVDQMGGRNEILRIAVFVAACKGTDLIKNLKIIFSIFLLGMLILAVLAGTGVLGTTTVVKEFADSEAEVTFCFGMGNANSFHCMFFALIILGLYIYAEKAKWWIYITLLIANVGMFFLTGCKTATVVGTIAILVLWITRNKNSRTLSIICSAVSVLSIALSILGASVATRVRDSYYGYSDDLYSRFLRKLDELLTGRLAILTETTTRDGSIESWTFWPTIHEAYFDMGIVRIFYWYGVFVSIVIFGVFLCLSIYLIRKGKTKELAFLAIISLYSVFEAHFVSIYIGRCFPIFILGGYWDKLLNKEVLLIQEKSASFDANRDSWTDSFLTVLSPIILWCILGPLEMYASNFGKGLIISKWTIVGIMFLVGSVVFAIFVVLLRFLPPKISRILTAVILGITVLSFASWGLKKFDIDIPCGFAIALWIGILLLFVAALILYERAVKRIVKYGKAVLAFICILMLVVMMLRAPAGTNNSLALSSYGKYDLANESNIITVVFENYGNKEFERSCCEDENLTSLLNDFTYYSNCDGGSYGLFPTLEGIVTGVKIEDYAGMSEDEFRKNAWSEPSATLFYQAFRDKSWHFNIFGDNDKNDFGYADDMLGQVENIEFSFGRVRWNQVIQHGLRYSANVFVPWISKDSVKSSKINYQEMNDLTVNGKDTVEETKQELMADGLTNTGETTRKVDVYFISSNGNESEPSQTEAKNEIITSFISEMKRLKKYDSSTIVFIGVSGYLEGQDTDPQPLMLVKEPNEVHAQMNADPRAVSLADVRRIWAQSANIEADYWEKDFLKSEYDNTQTRTFWVKSSGDELFYKGYTYSTDREELINALSEDCYDSTITLSNAG